MVEKKDKKAKEHEEKKKKADESKLKNHKEEKQPKMAKETTKNVSKDETKSVDKNDGKKPHVSDKTVSDETRAKKEKKSNLNVKLFNRWSSDIEVKDIGLKRYLNLDARIVPKSAGRYQKKKFHKSKMHIVERLALKLMVPGHSGKRHKISSGYNTPGFMKCLTIIEKAFEILENKTKKNPVEVFVRALENAAVREEVTSYQVGAIIARKAVITSPQRRIDKALRYFAQATYQKCHGKKTSAVQALADELLKAYNNSNESLAIREKERLEREAAGAR